MLDLSVRLGVINTGRSGSQKRLQHLAPFPHDLLHLIFSKLDFRDKTSLCWTSGINQCRTSVQVMGRAAEVWNCCQFALGC
jgi:hypothetical protein